MIPTLWSRSGVIIPYTSILLWRMMSSKNGYWEIIRAWLSLDGTAATIQFSLMPRKSKYVSHLLGILKKRKDATLANISGTTIVVPPLKVMFHFRSFQDSVSVAKSTGNLCQQKVFTKMGISIINIKTAMNPSYFCNGDSYTGKRTLHDEVSDHRQLGYLFN